ncbi:hypothetical protein BZG36_03197 [Bifiguratus adelaidae]|uniref:C2H2-type domain-containing protein n=1 Tax=Bifiguratus adelaidae TaxID=1938954 RepID=A0A261Y1C7_9FUNG|nr:hypothetical protein BZG36_03197 [Bifiguratus adelaidae]
MSSTVAQPSIHSTSNGAQKRRRSTDVQENQKKKSYLPTPQTPSVPTLAEVSLETHDSAEDIKKSASPEPNVPLSPPSRPSNRSPDSIKAEGVPYEQGRSQGWGAVASPVQPPRKNGQLPPSSRQQQFSGSYVISPTEALREKTPPQHPLTQSSTSLAPRDRPKHPLSNSTSPTPSPLDNHAEVSTSPVEEKKDIHKQGDASLADRGLTTDAPAPQRLPLLKPRRDDSSQDMEVDDDGKHYHSNSLPDYYQPPLSSKASRTHRANARQITQSASPTSLSGAANLTPHRASQSGASGGKDVHPSDPSRPYVCPECYSSFSRPHNLKSHLATHSSERPFPCPDCGHFFRRLHDLKRHQKLHTGEKPYKCDVCDRGFARLDALTRHKRPENGSACGGRQSRGRSSQSQQGSKSRVDGEQAIKGKTEEERLRRLSTRSDDAVLPRRSASRTGSWTGEDRQGSFSSDFGPIGHRNASFSEVDSSQPRGNFSFSDGGSRQDSFSDVGSRQGSISELSSRRGSVSDITANRQNSIGDGGPMQGHRFSREARMIKSAAANAAAAANALSTGGNAGPDTPRRWSSAEAAHKPYIPPIHIPHRASQPMAVSYSPGSAPSTAPVRTLSGSASAYTSYPLTNGPPPPSPPHHHHPNSHYSHPYSAQPNSAPSYRHHPPLPHHPLPSSGIPPRTGSASPPKVHPPLPIPPGNQSRAPSDVLAYPSHIDSNYGTGRPPPRGHPQPHGRPPTPTFPDGHHPQDITIQHLEYELSRERERARLAEEDLRRIKDIAGPDVAAEFAHLRKTINDLQVENRTLRSLIQNGFKDSGGQDKEEPSQD